MTFSSKIILLCALVFPAALATAHHSHAMFEDAQEVTLNGKVTAIRFINPHAKMLIEVENEAGEKAMWDIEMSDVNSMMTRGINRATFSVGDDVSIIVNPLRNGRPGGNYARIISINGVHNMAEGSNWDPAHPE
jgi:hypothetical protein